jgi:hypothetical protein
LLITNPVAANKIISLGLKAFTGSSSDEVFADQGFVGWAFIENIY